MTQLIRSIARGGRPSRLSACHALVGLLTPELLRNQPSHPPWRIMAIAESLADLLGYSGGAVPDSHRVPCSSAAKRGYRPPTHVNRQQFNAMNCGRQLARKKKTGACGNAPVWR